MRRVGGHFCARLSRASGGFRRRRPSPDPSEITVTARGSGGRRFLPVPSKEGSPQSYRETPIAEKRCACPSADSHAALNRCSPTTPACFHPVMIPGPPSPVTTYIATEWRPLGNGQPIAMKNHYKNE